MKLKIEIEFGNAEMLRYSQARKAIAERLSRESGRPHVGDSGGIMDINGNSVGRWEVVSD